MRSIVLVALLSACAATPTSSAPTAQSASTARAGITWNALPKLPAARDHHATFAVETPSGTYLYVAGGANGTDFLADAWRAKITGPGTTGAWEAIAPLPRAQAGAGVVASGRHVALVAG